jgi:hypothetical protein
MASQQGNNSSDFVSLGLRLNSFMKSLILDLGSQIIQVSFWYLRWAGFNSGLQMRLKTNNAPLHRMLEDPSYDSIVRWGENGDSFVVLEVLVPATLLHWAACC